MSLAMSTTANPAAALQSALSEAEKQSSLLSARRVLDEQTPALRELGQDPSLGLLELGDESRKGAIDAIVLNEEAAELVVRSDGHYSWCQILTDPPSPTPTDAHGEAQITLS